MQLKCSNSWCEELFSYDSEEEKFRARFGVEAPPAQCSVCRHRSRAIFKAATSFYRRSSDLSGKSIISIYHDSQPFPVYSIEEWWSDLWDATAYGRSWNSATDFFSQFAELSALVPRMANYNRNCENSEYSSYAGSSRNVYYSNVCFRSEDVLYSDTITGSCERVLDSLACFRSSDLCECILCRNVHSCAFLMRATDCRDCYFSYDLKGCRDCLFCSNLRNKQYYIRNQAVSRTEFNLVRATVLNGSRFRNSENLAEWESIISSAAHQHLELNSCEECEGDELHSCNRCQNCYFCSNTQGARNCIELAPSEKNLDSLDVTVAGVGELLFNSSILGGGNYFLRMCVNCRESLNLTYCIDCFSCKDCFGCIGLRNRQFCFLNKQYSPSDYTAIITEAVTRMKADGVWGDFFPRNLSPFAYNESAAQQLFPLEEKAAEEQGFCWRPSQESSPVEGIQVSEWPDLVSEISKDLLVQPMICSTSAKPFRIISQELELRRNLGVGPPVEHPEIRIAKRRGRLNPFSIRSGQCASCGATFRTAYRKSYDGRIMCTVCYQQTLVN